jgi:parallel beta-helix repeat protein
MKTFFRCFTVLLVSVVMTCVSRADSVRDFGAKGDGQADDTAAIQRAVNGCKDGELAFPAGDYRVTKTIEIKLAERGRLGLRGLGGAARVIMAGAGPAFRFTGTHTGSAFPDSFKPVVWQGERMPLVDSLEIVGAHAEADGLEFFQTMQATLRAVLIRETRHGVRLPVRNRNVLIDSCHIYNLRGVGVLFDKVNLHQAIIHGSHISYCKGGGIKIVGGEIRNFHVTGNDIEYNYDTNATESADIWFDVREGTVREGTIASNTIQAKVSPGGANIRFIGNPGTPDKVGLWTISGNHISNQEVNLHLQNVRGVTVTGNSFCLGDSRTLLLEGSRNLVVSDNSLDRNPDYFNRQANNGVANGITLRDCSGVVLSGNIVDESSAGSDKEGGAIELFNSHEVTLTGNQVFEPRWRGIYLTDSRNVRVSDNLVVDRRTEVLMHAAVQVAGQSKGVLITGNLVGKGSKGDILAPPFAATARDNQPAAR